jgi:Kef-type K+ transport system membrane component KefB
VSAVLDTGLSPLLLASSAAHGVPGMLVLLAVIVVGAKLAGELCERVRLPPVVGELLVGVLLGNLRFLGGPDLRGLTSDEAFVMLAELGAILLLFEVGLESTTKEMMAVGGRAMAVAVVGVVTPMILGYGVGATLRPDQTRLTHVFLGAMLTATSVGITARVLKDAGAVRTRFARIILGAAVIDDVLGLLVLAVVSGAIAAAASGGAIGWGALGLVVVKAFVFLAGALVIGSSLSPRVFRSALALRSSGVVQALSLGFCFALSWLAVLAGMAPIVGAYAAGLVLEEVHFKGQRERGEQDLRESLLPLVAFLVPVFFARMGMLVDLGAFASLSVLGFAAALTAAAVAGKLVTALVAPRGCSRLNIGLGMLPRGEVGLIFAGIGAQMTLFGRPLVDDVTYAAAVFMVVATTLMTPSLLMWSIRRSPPDPADAAQPGAAA